MEKSREHLTHLELDIKDLEELLSLAKRDHSRAVINKEIESLRRKTEQVAIIIQASEPMKLHDEKVVRP